MNIKAVGFDLDGTLYPAWLLYVWCFDLGIKHPRIMEAYRTARKDIRKLTALKPLNSEKEFSAVQASLVAQKLGVSEERARHLLEKTIYSVVENRFIHIKPRRELHDCLAGLKQDGIRLGLLSDLPPSKKLRHMGLDGYFEFALCSESAGSLKPDPKPFKALIEHFGLPAGEILYVGNSCAYDIEGAKNMGLKTALIQSRAHASCRADLVFQKWQNLLDWVRAQNAG